MWALQDAKNNFSEVVRRAEAEGPQVITRHGRDAAVVISPEQFQPRAAPAKSLLEALRDSPLAEFLEENPDIFDDIRDRSDTGRDIKLGD
ncbi:MAG: type II toxin-antitoxin system Phd/YefM family antitoxin [Rhodospirillaceae bacterium]|nr:type II toxin-antitoxin system Phd/YefM family antitoxin [Rhodospirillaceae bacterium]